jgi:pimeloyl-ACP methyl ester carboxylesterase
MDVEHHKAACNGQLIHYVRAGVGDPVVLLHGWPATWYHWRKLIPLLAPHHTVVAPDLRGFGDSSKPQAGYDTRTITEDVYQLVRQLGLGRVFVVGHDMGAVHAYTYANRYPDETRALAYLDEPLPGFGYEQFAQLQPDPAMQGGFFFAHFHLVPDLPEALVAGRERLYLEFLVRRMSYDPSAFTPADLDELARGLGGPGFRGSIGVYREIGETIGRTARRRRGSSRCRCSASAERSAWASWCCTTCGRSPRTCAAASCPSAGTSSPRSGPTTWPANSCASSAPRATPKSRGRGPGPMPGPPPRRWAGYTRSGASCASRHLTGWWRGEPTPGRTMRPPSRPHASKEVGRGGRRR